MKDHVRKPKQRNNLTPENYLSKKDPRLGALIRQVIQRGGRQRADRIYESAFHAFTRSIVSQQLSVKAAETIYARFRTLVGHSLTPESVRALPVEELRGAGLSSQKARYLHNLSDWFSVNAPKLDDPHLTDDALVALLTEISGIGVWTVQMFLIFFLKRDDILPLADLGVQKGIQLLHGLKKRPSPKTMLAKSKEWRPYRSIACLYLWRAFDLGLHKDPASLSTRRKSTPAKAAR